MPLKGSAVAKAARYRAVTKNSFPALWSIPKTVDVLIFIGAIIAYVINASISNLIHKTFDVNTRRS
jgi:hypothetical protein